MTETEREATLKKLREFAKQQQSADQTADKGSLERAADVVALYEDKAWVADMPAPKRLVSRGRPVDPESFSRFTKWLAERVPLKGAQLYRLREAHGIVTSFAAGEITPTGEWSVRPLKWMRKHDYGDRIPEVWELACKLAGGGAPDEPTVRKALSQWKHENVPKGEHATSRPRGGKALVDHWIAEAERIMREYPEQFAPALDRIMAEAEELMAEDERELEPVAS